MNKIQISLILLIIGIIACKKDSIQYPITYSSYSISGANIKVYTRDGEITSTALVSNVFAHYQSYLTNTVSADISGKFIANYISSDSVELTINNIKEDKRRSIHELAGMVYWEKQDTAWTGRAPFWDMDYLFQYLPLYYNKYNAPAGSGYYQYVKSRDCYFITKNRGDLNLPMFDFVQIISEYNFIQSTKGINNSFNKDGLINFFAGYNNDTILIQSYTVKMH